MALNSGAQRSALSILHKLDSKYTIKDANFVHANIQKYLLRKINEAEDVLAKIEEHKATEAQINTAGFPNFIDPTIKALHLLNILPDSWSVWTESICGAVPLKSITYDDVREHIVTEYNRHKSDIVD